MITEKMLIFLVLVASMPVAYTRHASLWSQVFPDDVILPSHHNDRPTRKIMDLEGTEVDLKKEIRQVQDQQNPEIEVVDSDEYHESHESEAVDVEVVDLVGSEADGTSYKVCKTLKCKELANEFLRSFNKSVNPCDNFYEFTCGGYKASNPIPPYRLFWNHFYRAQDLTKYRLKEILETEIKDSDILPVKQAKKWYKSCMNTERLERLGLVPVESIMMRAGGWPMAMNEDEWNENEIWWKDVESQYARLTGSYVFYKFRVPSSTSRNISMIYINAPPLALAGTRQAQFRNYNENGEYEVYRRLVSRVAKTFAKHYKASVSNKALYKASEELVLFEKELYQLARANRTTGIRTFEELSEMNNDDIETDSMSGSSEIIVDWSSKIQELFDLANIQVEPSINVRIKNMGYFEGIAELLQRTPQRTIVNYIHWHFLGKVLAFTNEEMRYEFSGRKFIRDYYKLKEDEPRWSECVDEMKMSHAASYAFVKKYFPTKMKKAAKEIIDNVRIGLEQNIDNSNYLDANSKTLSKEKVKNMKIFIGAPEWYSKSALTNYYKGITIGADNLKNNLNYMRYTVKQNLKLYVTPRPRLDPFMDKDDSPITANAFYITSLNYAEFPAAELQPPYFETDWPNNVNYGKIGAIIGHEMGHAFDNCGISYRENGRLAQLDEMILRSYYERVDCFINQFDKYQGIKKSINGTTWKCDGGPLKTKGEKTADENMADTTGLQAVFGAYTRMNMKKNPNGDVRLPGLEEFNDDQLFFLSFGVSYCEALTPEFAAVIKQGSTDQHSTPEFRVNGAVSNTKEFAEVFKCPAKSSMNPTNKCNVWEKLGARTYRAARNINHYSWDD